MHVFVHYLVLCPIAVINILELYRDKSRINSCYDDGM